MTTIAVTGHRGLPPATTTLIDAALRAEISKHTPTDLVGLSCIADGADALFAQAILDHGGTLHVIVPAQQYRENLPTNYQPTYDKLISKATHITTLEHVESNPEAHIDASLHMLTQADELIAIWDGKPARGPGGTADVVKAAHQHDLPVTIIWPHGAERD